jgi:hypothetical protein
MSVSSLFEPNGCTLYSKQINTSNINGLVELSDIKINIGNGVPVYINGVLQSEIKPLLREDIEYIYAIDEEENHKCVETLKPRRYKLKNDNSNCMDFGLIPDEIEYRDIIYTDDNDDPIAIKTETIPLLLITEIQRLNKKIDILESVINQWQI